ncbi:hypothetical protein Hanom_Chr15g01383331 [Helianthus anomalus]
MHLSDATELVITSNISSSDRSSPIHNTKSGVVPLSCMVASSRFTTSPLLTP